MSGPDGVDPDGIDTDVFDPRVLARGAPHDALRLLRDTAPVSGQGELAVGPWPAGPGFWAATRYDDVRHVLRSPADDPDPADLPFPRRTVRTMDAPAPGPARRRGTPPDVRPRQRDDPAAARVVIGH
ncbi:hypothetical protein WHI96_01345 [Pseudonocardia tropica]|uniref:Cytochrome P450 n=1 Tax=Pseudonocardia tropica TaxID=681289 RepID=A0ABV1JP22_9PSEU